ncbi:xylulokinase [Pseudohalocynthiibacter sp. F2068]|jgi:xylulokinase|uniref:xylulokinase n=1 Tax=Pseudohalocynthiibacter sp. F2068 TaxID=2926418 RepID=UPI001FF4175C|nr:xylulokinase [Pseudohalocynthiibacter sp. F2068]MCK0104431.1 xylulokinase [Pseudohalocynthiibacter sp. F2068]
MSDAMLLGVDLGAGSLKATIIGIEGTVQGEATVPIRTDMPKPGWSEQNPEDWYSGLCTAVPKAIKQSGVSAGALKAMSFSAGAHTPVLLDSNDQVIRPAILWSDLRSSGEARELLEMAKEEILRISFNLPAATWTLPQLLWLQRNEPDSVAAAKRLLIAKDYLRLRLTGEWHIDCVDAAGTMMADVRSNTWSPELYNLIDWDPLTLPPIVEPTRHIGNVSKRGASDSGLPEGLPVIAGTMDTAIETFGAGSINPGDGTIKLATAGTVCVVSDRSVAHRSVIDYPHVVPGRYFSITGTNSCASAHRWLCDLFYSPGTTKGAANIFEVMDLEASKVPAGSDGMLFHPYLSGERSPYWDEKLRADFIGVTMRHSRGHFVRALYEGIAFSLFDCNLCFKAEGLEMETVRLIGGGSKSATWSQIVCDVFGKPVSVPVNGDASFGAALLAGVGIGVFASEAEAVSQCVRVARVFEPNVERTALYRDLFEIYKDSQASLASINHRLFNFSLGQVGT